jgi:hypothetical protein
LAVAAEVSARRRAATISDDPRPAGGASGAVQLGQVSPLAHSRITGTTALQDGQRTWVCSFMLVPPRGVRGDHLVADATSFEKSRRHVNEL